MFFRVSFFQSSDAIILARLERLEQMIEKLLNKEAAE